MVKKTITLGTIFGLITLASLFFWWIGFSGKVVSDPTNPKNVEEVALKVVDEATPPQVNIIMILAPLGVIGAIAIVLIIIFWDRIMNFKIPLS